MISVCIATYNGSKYIKEQIHSILGQLESNDELIVSDDGSTDDTISIIESFSDIRIKIFFNEKSTKFNNYLFYNTTKNFENAINQAKGDLIFLCDQDDIWEHNKVEIIKNNIGDKNVLLHDCMVVDSCNDIIFNSYFELVNVKGGFINNIIKSSYLGCCMAFKREIVDMILPFPEFPVPHDIWIGLISEWNNDIVFINDKLIRYRRHDSNLSPSSKTSPNSLLYKIKYRVVLIDMLIARLLKFVIVKSP